jgi:HK97 family phage major capsid protein
MELKELNESIEGMGKAFEQFKTANDKRLDQLEKRGTVDPLVTETLEKLNKEMDTHQDTIDKIEVTMKRVAVGAIEGKEVDLAAKAHKEHFEKFVRSGDEAGLLDAQMKSLSVGVDSDGGYTVTPETSNEILRTITETSPIRQIASVISIGTDSFQQLRRTGGASSGGWVTEKGSRSETGTPTLGRLDIPVHEQYAEPAATQKLLDDSSINIESWLGMEISDIISETENTSFVLGDGVGKPRGFLAYDSGTSDEQIEQIVSGTSGEVTADGLINVQTALKEGYQAGANWVMSRATRGLIRLLKDTGSGTDQYMWQPGLTAGEPDTLLGKSITLASDMPVAGANSLSIAYGDFRRGYKIVDRSGVTILRDPFTNKPFVLFYAVKRVGGAVVNFEAIKINKFGT